MFIEQWDDHFHHLKLRIVMGTPMFRVLISSNFTQWGWGRDENPLAKTQMGITLHRLVPAP